MDNWKQKYNRFLFAATLCTLAAAGCLTAISFTHRKEPLLTIAFVCLVLMWYTLYHAIRLDWEYRRKPKFDQQFAELERKVQERSAVPKNKHPH
jgi:hypothetical protein